MKIQHIIATSKNGILSIQWSVLCDAKNICVQIATNIEFTDLSRLYVLPPSSQCHLTVSNASWFIRVGAWLGDNNNGTIMWSGIVGPFDVESENSILSPPLLIFPSIDSQSIQKGVRIQTGYTKPYYAILEYSIENQFLASQTKMLYAYDWGRGYVDCMGLSDKEVYYIRIYSISENPGSLVQDSIRLISQGAVLLLKTAARPIEFASNAELNSYRNDEILLRNVKEMKDYKFTSYAEYNRYKLASMKLIG